MDSRSTGFALIFDRMKMSRRFFSVLTYLSIASDIQPFLTSHLLESIDAFAVSSSVTKQPAVPMSQNATSAEKITNTIEVVRMLLNAPIAMPNTWLVRRNVQWRLYIVERRDSNKKREQKLINSRQRPISLLLLDCIRVFFKQWLLTFMQRRKQPRWLLIVWRTKSINLQSSLLRSRKKSGVLKKFSSVESRNSRRNAT